MPAPGPDLAIGLLEDLRAGKIDEITINKRVEELLRVIYNAGSLQRPINSRVTALFIFSSLSRELRMYKIHKRRGTDAAPVPEFPHNGQYKHRNW